jgi:hypothetical protein
MGIQNRRGRGSHVTPPPGVFGKFLKGKQLSERVCEICAGKGLRVGEKEAKEVDEAKEVKEGDDLAFRAFMTWVPSERRGLGRGAKNSGSGRAAESCWSIPTTKVYQKIDRVVK